MAALPNPSPIKRYQQWLVQNGMQMNIQRRALAVHILALDERFMADDVVAFVCEQATSRISRPTIFRTLSEFVKCGLLNEKQEDGTWVYYHQP